MALRVSKDKEDRQKRTPAVAGWPPGLDLPARLFLEARVLPGSFEGSVLSVLADERSNLSLMETAAQAHGWTLNLQLGERDQLDKGLSDLREAVLEDSAKDAGAESDAENESAAYRPRQQERLQQLVAQAVGCGASDIHLEPGEDHAVLRLRIDGQLERIENLGLDEAAALVAQVKVLAHLPVSERRLPHDGRLAVEAAGQRVEMRASILPSVHGEALVLRVSGDRAPTTIEDLRMPDSVRAALLNALARRTGLVLVGGPTGSGKTSTLYALMRFLAQPGRKCLSVEDPVEAYLPGVNQVPVTPGGMGFASAVRAMLRHAPDVILVGEIRDAETAKAATEAALTGHLVLASIHARDAAETITRMVELGTQRDVLASALSAVLEQRLVRCLCANCRKPAELRPSQMEALGLAEAFPVFESAGCPDCASSGFSGRMGVFGIISITPPVRDGLAQGANADRIRSLACDQPAIKADLIAKLRAGAIGLRDALLEGAHLAADISS